MKTATIKKQNFSTDKNLSRSYYLDNLKVFLTILVIAHHAMIPFTGGEGWPYQPSNAAESMPYMWRFLSTNAAFFMGLFFMISGFFVPKSFEHQGFARFVGKKSLRLLVPFAIISTILSVASGTPESGHTWFLSSLFLFCLIYALGRKVLLCIAQSRQSLNRKSQSSFMSDNDKPAAEKQTRLSFPMLILFAAVMGVFSYIIRRFYPQDKWIILWVFKFEPAHYLQYIMMFAFGVKAGRGNWFEKMNNKTGCLAFAIGLLLCIGNYLRNDGFWGGFVWRWFGIYESFLCVFLCVGLVWLFKTFGNWNSSFCRWTAAQAFGAYIIHLFVLLIVQNLLDKVWLGICGKYFVVLVLSTAASFGLIWVLRTIILRIITRKKSCF